MGKHIEGRIKMANTEIVVQIVENGSNVMNTYQAILSALQTPSDSLSLILNGSTLIAAVSNVVKILQPIRIETNLLVATSALIKITMDWKDPNKKVQVGDVLTLASASTTVALNVLVLAEIGPAAAIGLSALVLSADLQAIFTPYVKSLTTWMRIVPLNLAPPVSTASSSLYWSTFVDGTGYRLATYDEVIINKGLFICMSNKQVVGGAGVSPYGSPVPGSLTPVNEAEYKKNYCKYLGDMQQVSDWTSWMDYCENTKF